MNRIICIGQLENKYVFYNLDYDEFYVAEYDYFDDFEDINEENDFSEEEKKRMESVRVTDEELLEDMRECYEEYKKEEAAHQKRLEDIKRSTKKRINKSTKENINEFDKKKELLKDIKKGILIIGVLVMIYNWTDKLREDLSDKINAYIDKYHQENQNDEKHLGYFMASIDDNLSISDELRVALKNDFNKLVESNIYISDIFKFDGICNRLKNTDFTGYTVNNYTDLLAKIIFNNENILSRCVAKELDESANNREPSELSLLFGSLSTGMNKDVINDLFNYGKIKYIDDLACYYEVNHHDINKLIDLLEKFADAESAEEKERISNEFNHKLSGVLTNYYLDYAFVSDIHKYILASKAYNGGFTISNNYFNDYIVISYNDPAYGMYNLYFDSVSKKDVTDAVYYQKLVDLIKEKGNNLDYSDPDCRFLLYMIMLTYEDKMYFDCQELLDSQTPEELATLIIETSFDDEGFVKLKSQIIYSFFTTGKMNLNYIIREINSPNDDALSMALFQEFYKCLKIDNSEGNLSDEDYQDYEEYTDKWINKKHGDYEILLSVLNTEESLFSEFTLYPFSVNYANEEIKKYIYIPKDQRD